LAWKLSTQEAWYYNSDDDDNDEGNNNNNNSNNNNNIEVHLSPQNNTEFNSFFLRTVDV
jgi:hypothetical protein